MGRTDRFAEADVERLPLSDGDWIEVWRDLNTGQQKKLEGAGTKNPIKLESGEVYTPVDWEVYELERAMIFLTAWSLHDKQDKPVKLTMDALRALKPPDFEEINSAIIAYVMRRAMEKNALRATSSGSTESIEPPVSEPIST